MNGENQESPVRFVLSREELIFVLNKLQVSIVPGLDADPVGELTPEQQAWSMVTAQRALQARELVQIRSDGVVAVHNSVLTAVGICAYAERTVFVYHWPVNEDLPVRTFCHRRGDQAVFHRRPSDVLHEFTLMSASEDLADQILHACTYKDVRADGDYTFKLPNDAFVEARTRAAGNEVSSAQSVLIGVGVEEQAAQSFAETLAGTARVSILQMVKQEGGEVKKADLTLLQDGSYPWLLQPVEEDPTALTIKTLPRQAIVDLLNDWL